jgi:predicted nucleotidyltransferase
MVAMISRDQALGILRRHKAELEALGIRRAAVFGSVSRGEARPDSDLDIMIELDDAHRLTAFDYAGIKEMIADLFPVRTDIVATDFLKKPVSNTAARDAVYAF